MLLTGAKKSQIMQEQQEGLCLYEEFVTKHGTCDHTKVESHSNEFFHKLVGCYLAYIQCILFHKLKNILKNIVNS